ncbi:MAG: hypothetical protein FVQ78_08645 [Solirubrobacterales bacterium]|nr:hypothetical protein [Solirubrobacterales bacterium]
MPDPELTPEQSFALIDELDTAAKLTQHGMDALHELDAANDFHHLPMQLLSQGFERLLKVTYAMALRERSGAMPTVASLKRDYGHDLTKINDALIEVVTSNEEYAARPAVRDDLDFLSADRDLRRVLKLLSSFGTWSRYYNLGVLLDPSSAAAKNDPALAWQAIERESLQRMPEGLERLGQPSELTDLFQEIYEEISKTLDRFTRAISRMWTLGPLGPEGQRHMGLIKEFLFLRDEELGRPR